LIASTIGSIRDSTRSFRLPNNLVRIAEIIPSPAPKWGKPRDYSIRVAGGGPRQRVLSFAVALFRGTLRA
jgi:hypothetical protein